MKTPKFLAFVLLGSALFNQAFAGINVDGKLDIGEWFIDKSTWSVKAGIEATVEDWTRVNNGFLDPGYGGQSYDAEAIFATIEGGKLFIALVTGHDPLTRTHGNNYGAGDFAIDFGKNGTYELGINYRNPNARDTWATVDKFGEQGGVYQNPSWALGLWNDNSTYKKSEHPTSLIGGTQIGTAAFAVDTVGATGYGQYSNDRHYFYEMSIDTELLKQAGWDGNAFNIHWTENCANDSIIVDPPAAVPEPGSLALIGAGLFGVMGMRRRNKQNS